MYMHMCIYVHIYICIYLLHMDQCCLCCVWPQLFLLGLDLDFQVPSFIFLGLLTLSVRANTCKHSSSALFSFEECLMF